MALGILTDSGARVSVIVPTRYHAYTAGVSKYSLSAAVDFLADAGFDGADLSLDQLEPDGDDVLRSVLYGFGNRAAARGLKLPVCHLPFYMPDPDDAAAMARFSREVASGIRGAAMLRIPEAVIHPIVRHGSQRSREAWLAENKIFFTPLRELAERSGVRLCVENMAGKPYAAHPAEAVYGSRAADLLALSESLDVDICWDFGHANLTGLCQSAELEQIRGRVRVLHIHDNDGVTDGHLLPFQGDIDWADAAEGLRLCEFLARPNRCLDMELKTSHLPADRAIRMNHASEAICAARRLASLM